MARIPDPLPLYHGTLASAAEAAVASGFKSPNVRNRLKALADRYGVDYDALAVEVGEFVWHRERNDPYVHFATNPRLAASYARRGSEIDHFGLQAVWRLQNPTKGKRDRSWWRHGEDWAKAEVARTHSPALVRVDVPHAELPRERLDRIETKSEILGDSQATIYAGEEILLLPEVASKYAVSIEPVEPCTCWRDRPKCEVCRDWNFRSGGWNGTFFS